MLLTIGLLIKQAQSDILYNFRYLKGMKRIGMKVINQNHGTMSPSSTKNTDSGLMTSYFSSTGFNKTMQV